MVPPRKGSRYFADMRFTPILSYAFSLPITKKCVCMTEINSGDPCARSKPETKKEKENNPSPEVTLNKHS